MGNPYGFTGRQLDSETGLYYYRARMYSPELGRFLQVDPVGYVDSMNLYVYCENNPINFTDPYGLCEKGESFEYNDPFDPYEDIDWDLLPWKQKDHSEAWQVKNNIIPSVFVGGNMLHSDKGQQGEKIIHIIKDKWNFRFNRLGKWVDHNRKGNREGKRRSSKGFKIP